MPRRTARTDRVPFIPTSPRHDTHSNTSAKPLADESLSAPSPKESSTTSTWRSRLGSARGKHTLKGSSTGAGAQKPDTGAKAGIIEFWADVWASGGDEDMLPPLPEHKPTETLSVDLGLEDGGAAREVSLADLIKPARSLRKATKGMSLSCI